MLSSETSSNNTETVKRKRSIMAIIPWTVVAIIVVFAAVLVAAVLSGRVYIGTKSPEQKVQTAYSVCEKDTVKKYNDIVAQSQLAETDADFKKYESQFDNVAKDVAAKVNSDKDPTCQYILFLTYQYKGDVTNMEKTAKNIIELNEDGKYINNEVGEQTYSIDVFWDVIGGKDS